MQDIAIILSSAFVAMFAISLAVLAALEVRAYRSWAGRFDISPMRRARIRRTVYSVIGTALLTALIAITFMAGAGLLAAIVKGWLGSGLV